MNFKKKTLGLVTAIALTSGALTTTAFTVSEANAAVVGPTATTIELSKSKGNYGDNLGLWINSTTKLTTPVNDSDRVWAGTAHLQMKANGSSTWKTVASDSSPGYQYFENVNFVGNAKYRVYYQGMAYDDYPEDVTYLDSYSKEVTVKTYRNLTIKDKKKKRAAIGTFKATPKFAGKKFVFHKKVGKKWKVYKKVKANKKGAATVKFATQRFKRTHYMVTVPGDKQFTATKHKFYAYGY